MLASLTARIEGNFYLQNDMNILTNYYLHLKPLWEFLTTGFDCIWSVAYLEIHFLFPRIIVLIHRCFWVFIASWYFLYRNQILYTVFWFPRPLQYVVRKECSVQTGTRFFDVRKVIVRRARFLGETKKVTLAVKPVSYIFIWTIFAHRQWLLRLMNSVARNKICGKWQKKKS